jgi:hypothetical protein
MFDLHVWWWVAAAASVVSVVGNAGSVLAVEGEGASSSSHVVIRGVWACSACAALLAGGEVWI